MNRLVRIAITLFVSATIMIFLIRRRLDHIPEIRAGELYQNDQLVDHTHNEILMSVAGMVITAIMLIAGLTLLVIAFLRSRKKSAGHG